MFRLLLEFFIIAAHVLLYTSYSSYMCWLWVCHNHYTDSQSCCMSPYYDNLCNPYTTLKHCCDERSDCMPLCCYRIENDEQNRNSSIICERKRACGWQLRDIQHRVNAVLQLRLFPVFIGLHDFFKSILGILDTLKENASNVCTKINNLCSAIIWLIYFFLRCK